MDDVETKLHSLIRAGALDEAATKALEAYGPELYGFLVHLMGGEPAAAEVFSQTAEDLWRGLPAFEMRCAVRTWMYLLARVLGLRRASAVVAAVTYQLSAFLVFSIVFSMIIAAVGDIP